MYFNTWLTRRWWLWLILLQLALLLGAWAYGAVYGTSAERTAALPGWLELYNWRRPHGSLSHQPPATRINNLVGNYS